MSEQPKLPEWTTTRADYEWINSRISDVSKKIRLLTRVLVDKKIIGDEVAKSFEETHVKEITDWYIEKYTDKQK